MSAVDDFRAEALFVSDLQPSAHPAWEQVRDTVHEVAFRLGELMCSERVATEFGDHPAAACERMAWCLAAVKSAFDLAGAR